MAVSYLALRHVGKFRRGFIYTSEQLGVLGRMAVKSGHLIPAPEPSKKPVRKKPAQSQRRKRGWADGEVAVQAGSGEELRDDSGSQGGQVVHGGDQPEG